MTGLTDEIEKNKQNQKALDELRQNYETNSADVKLLQDKFADHDLAKLTQAKPKLIQKIINKATRKSIDDFNKAAESIK